MGDATETADDAATLGSIRERVAAITAGDCVGRYTIRSLLGTGGMGQVYEASDLELGRAVALKLIHTERTSPQARLRLVREARALARLQHPNVVAVHDIGTGEPMFIAMELVSGPTLEGWLRDGSRAWREVVRVMADAGRGLAAAHAAGVIHRDFKPSNAIVGERVVVVDFGIARVDEDEPSDHPPRNALSMELTETGALVGTIAYMAPEQADGIVTEAADQYAFCRTLWQALYGALPTVKRKRPGSTTVPMRIHAIVERGLAVDPAKRWPDMQSLVAALDRTIARRARITAVLAVALVMVAIGSIIGWRVMHGRTEQRIAAERLGREAEQLRGQMRAARMLPAHDIVVERTQLRAQMKAIEREMTDLGDAAVGPGEFALGAAWFSLGRNRDARAEAGKHLQRAWDAGERRPELAFELGYVLEGEYELQIQNAPAVEGAEREKYLDDLHHRLRDPAITYLRQATGIDTTGEYIEAMIAQTEGRYADAITHGEAALRAQPTLYEAGLLAANALSHVTMVAEQKGDAATAATSEQRMLALFDKSADIARSDEFVYRTYTRAMSAVAAREDNNGKDIAAMLDRVEDLTGTGAMVDSEAPWPDITHARTLNLYAINDAHHHRDPHAHLDAAIAAAEHAVARDPKQLEAQLALGDGYGNLVDFWDTPHGLDPRAALEKSIAAYQAALAIAPDPDVAGNLALTFTALAHWQWGHGVDARAAVESAVKSDDDAYRMLPMDSPGAHPNACAVLAEYARSLVEHGHDAAAELARAKPYCDAALAETPGQEPTRHDVAIYEHAAGLAAARAGTDPHPAWARAEAQLARAIELAPKAHGLLAQLRIDRAAYELAHHARPDWSGALVEARLALSIDPADEDASRALILITIVAARAGDRSLLAEGARAGASLLARDSDDARLWILAGELALQQGKPHDGLTFAERALALDPHHDRAMQLKAAAR